MHGAAREARLAALRALGLGIGGGGGGGEMRGEIASSADEIVTSGLPAPPQVRVRVRGAG